MPISTPTTALQYTHNQNVPYQWYEHTNHKNILHYAYFEVVVQRLTFTISCLFFQIRLLDVLPHVKVSAPLPNATAQSYYTAILSKIQTKSGKFWKNQLKSYFLPSILSLKNVTHELLI